MFYIITIKTKGLAPSDTAYATRSYETDKAMWDFVFDEEVYRFSSIEEAEDWYDDEGRYYLMKSVDEYNKSMGIEFEYQSLCVKSVDIKDCYPLSAFEEPEDARDEDAEVEN